MKREIKAVEVDPKDNERYLWAAAITDGILNQCLGKLLKLVPDKMMLRNNIIGCIFMAYKLGRQKRTEECASRGCVYCTHNPEVIPEPRTLDISEVPK